MDHCVSGDESRKERSVSLCRPISVTERGCRNAETSRRFLDVLSHRSDVTDDDRRTGISPEKGLPEMDKNVVRADKIRKAVRHIQAIVQQVQLASEVGERAAELHIDAVDLRALVEDIILEVPIPMR